MEKIHFQLASSTSVLQLCMYTTTSCIVLRSLSAQGPYGQSHKEALLFLTTILRQSALQSVWTPRRHRNDLSDYVHVAPVYFLHLCSKHVQPQLLLENSYKHIKKYLNYSIDCRHRAQPFINHILLHTINHVMCTQRQEYCSYI